MSYLTVDDAAQMGELGRNPFKKIRKAFRSFHKKVTQAIVPKPIRKAMEKVHGKVRATVKKVGDQVLGKTRQRTYDGESEYPSGELNNPMPRELPLTDSALAHPPPRRDLEERTETPTSEPIQESESAKTSLAPVDIEEEPRDLEREHEYNRQQQMKFVDDQTNPQINESNSDVRHEETIDGLGRMIVTQPGYSQVSIFPKRRQAEEFDRATNPHLYVRKHRWRGKPVHRGYQASDPMLQRRKMVRMGNDSGVSGIGQVPYSDQGSVDGFPPETAGGNVGLAAVGAVVYAVSGAVPAKYSMLAKLAGLGALIVGGVNAIMKSLPGNPLGPKRSVGPGIVADADLANMLRGKIDRPVTGSNVSVSTWLGQYDIAFTIENMSDKGVTVTVEFRSDEVYGTGDRKRSVSSHDVSLGPKETKRVTFDSHPSQAGIITTGALVSSKLIVGGRLISPIVNYRIS